MHWDLFFLNEDKSRGWEVPGWHLELGMPSRLQLLRPALHLGVSASGPEMTAPSVSLLGRQEAAFPEVSCWSQHVHEATNSFSARHAAMVGSGPERKVDAQKEFGTSGASCMDVLFSFSPSGCISSSG